MSEAMRSEDHAFYTEIAENLGVPVRSDEPMRRHTTMGIGGPVSFMYFPKTIPDAAHLFGALQSGPLPIRLHGAGSNLLVDDEGVRAVVVTTSSLAADPQRTGETTVQVSAGTPVPGLVRWTAKEGLSGLEFAEGIPAQIGGATRMNAGAQGTCFGNVLGEVTFATPSGECVTRRTTDDDFSYRTSFVAREGVMVLGAEISLARDDTAAIKERIRVMRNRRRESQPVQERSSGCIFANLEGCKIGALIDQLGLKGSCVGGAVVSEVHANFIVNRGGARFEDVLRIIARMREAVLRETGETPRLEVEIWSDRDQNEYRSEKGRIET